MSKRICWKKGMRLTDEVLRASDDATAEAIGKALTLAAAGRFGLLPCSRPFQIALNITKESVNVESLSCFAVTKGGHLIDVHYDTRYTRFFETAVRLPNHPGTGDLFLVLNVHPDQWEETIEGFEEHPYDFSLITSDSPVAEDALPVARPHEIGAANVVHIVQSHLVVKLLSQQCRVLLHKVDVIVNN